MINLTILYLSFQFFMIKRMISKILSNFLEFIFDYVACNHLLIKIWSLNIFRSLTWKSILINKDSEPT